MACFALLVGLTHVNADAYGNWTGESGCWGCKLDVESMQLMLQSKGFAPFNIRTRLNEAATAENILRELHFFAEQSAPDDLFVFYYSGHGGQLADTNDDDEPDGKDETLLLYDRQLIDDELRTLWPLFKGNVVSIFDSCHSASADRGGRREARMRRSGISFQKSMSLSIQAAGLVSATNERRDSMREPPSPAARKIHIGACRDELTSAGTRAGGVFTLALIQKMKLGFTGSYNELVAQLNRTIRGQTAVISGDRSLTDAAAFQLSQRSAPAPANQKTVAIDDLDKVVAILKIAEVQDVGGVPVDELANQRPRVKIGIDVSW